MRARASCMDPPPFDFTKDVAALLGVARHCHVQDSEDVECSSMTSERRAVVGITSIPNELLAIILEASYDAGACPFTISSVSRHWREVTHNLPCLWVNIVIDSTP